MNIPVRWLAVGLVLVMLLMCLGLTWPVELLAYLAGGWALYLWRTVGEVTVDWPSLGLGAAALALFAGGLHAFLRWFSRNWAMSTSHPTDEMSPGAGAASSVRSPWQPRWTTAIVAMVVTLFVAGIAMVGMTHQTAWMATSPEPLVASNFVVASRNSSLNNLKQFHDGLKSYGEMHQTLPAGSSLDGNGRLMHGWISQLLPFLEQAELHKSINFNVPWDHRINQAAYQKGLDVVKIDWVTRETGEPPVDPRGYPVTDYTANVHVIGGAKPRRMDDIPDGLSNTILLGEAHKNRQPWGSPTNWRDPAEGLNKSPTGFGGVWPGGMTQLLFADGHARAISDDIDPAVLRAMATPDGGEKPVEIEE
jgi:prepilin-type processing-associated H-X9-DG protein